MADNEKLDNQRLKNFKNKGRDLEVKYTDSVDGSLFICAILLLGAALCDVVCNFQDLELCTQPKPGLI